MKKLELKPCHICGAKPTIEQWSNWFNGERSFAVRCANPNRPDSCDDGFYASMSNDLDETVRKWNDFQDEKERTKEMIEYPKIPAIFKRDTEGTKKLIEGEYCDETVEFLKDNTWVCTEKIDGTNIGIVWDGHKVSYQGRTDRAKIPEHLLNKLEEIFGGNSAEELFEQKFGEMPVILFGEGYGTKIQNGGNYRSDVSFILFDVLQPNKHLWLKRDAVEDIAKTFGIDVVPVIIEGTLAEAVSFVKSKPKSTIGTADMEGLVCKPKQELLDRRGRRIIVKVKVCDFC